MDSFYNLGGNTIAEHKRNFNKYLFDLCALNKSEAITIINNLHPRNHQQNIFQQKLLSAFEQYEKLLHNLYMGNRILNKLILKDTKFCKYIVDDISPTDFVNNVCPMLSYATRDSLLYKISWIFEQPANEHFHAIREKYGLQIALKILPSCSIDLIEMVLKETNCYINYKHLIRLNKKYPGFIKLYYQSNRDCFRLSDTLCLYLLYNDPEAVDCIRCVGKRSFKKYFNLKYKEIVDKPADFIKYIKLIKHETENKDIPFDVVLKNLFPVNCKDFHINSNIIAALKLFPRQLRGSIFMEIYKQTYGICYSCPDGNITMLNILDRNDWNTFNNNCIEYNPCEKSIPLIKSKINFTSDIYERGKLLSQLIQTCKVNENEDALLDVLKYICFRHKNDLPYVRESILLEIDYQYAIEDFTHEIWHYLKELLFTFEVNGEFNEEAKSLYLEKMILIKMRNGEEYIKEFTDYIKETEIYFAWSILRKYPKYRREVILRYTEINMEEDKDQKDICFLKTIFEFNRDNKDMVITSSDCPQMMDLVYKQLNSKKSGHSQQNLFEGIFSCTYDVNLKVELAEKYLSLNDSFTSNKIYLWILKCKPQLLLTCPERVIANYANANFYYELNKMHYIDMPAVFANIALKKFNSEDLEEVGSSLKLLSWRDNYLALIKKHQPVPIVDSGNKRFSLLKFHKTILYSLRNLFIPSDAINIIYDYLQEDFIENALPILHFASYHCRSSLFDSIILPILEKPVSVSKHAIILSSILSELSIAMKQIEEIGENEELKKFVFRSMIRTFVKNPTEDLFKLLQDNLTIIDKDDAAVLKMLVKVDMIPMKFKLRYIESIWNFLKEKGLQYHIKLLRFMDLEMMGSLNANMREDILSAVLFHCDKELYHKFAFEYLIVSQNLQVFWNIIRDYMKDYENYLQLIVKIQMFDDLFRYILERLFNSQTEEIRSKAICSKILAGLVELKVPNSLTYLNIKFDLASHYLQLGIKSFQNYLIMKQKDFLESETLNIYWDCAKFVLNEVIANNDINSHVEILEEMLLLDSSCEVKLLVLHLLPNYKSACYSNRINKLLDSILDNNSNAINIFLYTKYLGQ